MIGLATDAVSRKAVSTKAVAETDEPRRCWINGRAGATIDEAKV